MRLIRTLPAILLGVLAAVSLLLAAPVAWAHDAAESTSPANGATVGTVPDKVSVTFGNRPLALGSQIAVNDAQGSNWADGAVEIVDNTVSQKLKPGAPAGRFTVVWRVVSSDSHPIEGNFSFTATAASGSAGSTAATAPVPTAGTAPGNAGTGQPTTPEASQPLPWSIVGFATVALALLVILGVSTRRRLSSGDEDVEADKAAAEDEETAGAEGAATAEAMETLEQPEQPDAKPEEPGAKPEPSK